MADLVTHCLAARIPTSRIDRPLQAAVVVGTILPDLLSKAHDVVFHAPRGFEIPSHSVVGLAIYAYMASFLFQRPVRPRAWSALWLGGLIHIAVDLLKDTMESAASAFFLFPFTGETFEFALYDPLDVLWSIPVAAAILVLWEWSVRRRGRYVWE